jgi:hypothetical protein
MWRGHKEATVRYSVRDLVYIGVFGALWGTLEMTLGAYLHALGIPLIGLIMGSIGALILLVGRLFVSRRGSTVMIGVVTAIIKLMSIGSVRLNPMIAILMESLLAEAGLLAARQARRSSFVLAGALAVSWDFFHRFLTQGLIAGRGLLEIYRWTVEDALHILGIPVAYAVGGIAALLALRVVAGMLAGLLAWDVGRVVTARVAPPARIEG